MNVYAPTTGASAAAVTGETPEATLPALVLQREASHRGRVIMRKKDRGIWKEITWSDLATRSRHVGLGLIAAGFASGERAAVLAETGAEWAYADLGIMGARGVSVGVYPTSSAQQVADVLRDCGATVLFVENEEQLDKALEAREACPALRRIVVFRMIGLRDLQDPMCESLDALLARGSAHEQAHPGAWQASVASISGDDLALLMYTSGTTGAPRGAMLNHRAIMVQMVNAAMVLDEREGDERLAFMPMGHVAERVVGLYRALYGGTITNYPESPDTVLENLREVQPTILGGVPRFWERFHSRTIIAVADATWLQRVAYRWAVGFGQRRADLRLAGRRPSPFLALACWLGYRLALRNIRREMGLDRLRWGLVGGAPVAPELIRWYLALGLELLEVYGLTECGGLAAVTPRGGIRLNAAGRPVPYGELAVAPDGEVLIRGGHVFQGYWNEPEATARALRDGWLHSGDIGVIEDGFLRITGRVRDVITTAGGASVKPAEIETALKFSPYIANAMVIGDGRHFLTCLVVMDDENVEKWAQDNAVPFTSFASLVRTDAVRGLIEAELARVNARLGGTEPIRTFRLIDRKLAPEDAELTPTMTLRRSLVHEKYADLIETMYSET
jgi:long-chain acyl-CoA synthetase